MSWCPTHCGQFSARLEDVQSKLEMEGESLIQLIFTHISSSCDEEIAMNQQHLEPLQVS